VDIDGNDAVDCSLISPGRAETRSMSKAQDRDISRAMTEARGDYICR
jgi:hypothetical protein